jgi:glycosyltransferase involved in cell wall biosynthesis
MKKILYIITQSEVGGAQQYIFDLLTNFKQNFELTVAFGEQGERGELARKIKEIGISSYTMPHLKRTISPINDFLALIEIIKLIKKLKPDIIHLNSSKVSILGSLASLCVTRSKLYVIYTVHGWVFNEPLSTYKKLFYKYAEKITALFKDKIICVSKLDYEIARNQLKISETKLILIHHGIRPINFKSREEAQQKLLSQLQINKNNIVIGSIANLYKTKGIEYLIRAIKLLNDRGINAVAIVIGEGDERKSLENLIARNNLKNNFILAGKIDNAAKYILAFDIYVCSSVKEGFPYSILEAMQAGLPIVATNVGGTPEMITDGENGLLVEPQNSEKLAQRIRILIENNEIKNIISEQAKKNAKEKFGIEKMIEKTKEIYLK